MRCTGVIVEHVTLVLRRIAAKNSNSSDMDALAWQTPSKATVLGPGSVGERSRNRGMYVGRTARE